MKRNYISPEFIYTRVEGTFNMKEERTFFGSKMLEIEDIVTIDDGDIIYYQKTNGEQENLTQEKLLPPVIYSNNNDKEDNHTLEIDKDQTEFEKINNTKWILTVDTADILRNHIFAQLKSSRVFEGVLSEKTRNNNIDQAIYDYVDQNVMDRYDYNDIKLYLRYNSLMESGNYQSSDLSSDRLILSPGGATQDPTFLAQNGNTWDVTINDSSNLETKLQTDITFDQSTLTVKFKQSKKRIDYNFNYYFDLVFKKA
ncbi:MAG: hypothetical protein SLAVMIC_00934 [uncultured marine phage]|uniref:Uncharacterized protein n=1 Tax=uncultured marine phage TaxID=707152 RepID=A0A8D9CAW8_9VIRU|nr:MAG: hypothetical protein SLAVMIC_00934 [uncultured marine phage]